MILKFGEITFYYTRTISLVFFPVGAMTKPKLSQRGSVYAIYFHTSKLNLYSMLIIHDRLSTEVWYGMSVYFSICPLAGMIG